MMINRHFDGYNRKAIFDDDMTLKLLVLVSARMSARISDCR